MTHITCRLTATNQDQLRNPTLGNRVWATFTFLVEDVMDRCKWRKVIKEARWSGWVWVGECFFWYRPTWVVPDQRPLSKIHAFGLPSRLAWLHTNVVCAAGDFGHQCDNCHLPISIHLPSSKGYANNLGYHNSQFNRIFLKNLCRQIVTKRTNPTKMVTTPALTRLNAE